jgi:hypothetical protein
VLRSRPSALRSVLLVAAGLAGLVTVRSLAIGGLDRPMTPPAATRPTSDARGVQRPHISAPAGTRLSLGGYQPIVVDLANGSVSRIALGTDPEMMLFRQGRHSVLIANGRAWAVPAGRASPARSLGPAVAALPALGGDRVWLVTIDYQRPERWWRLVEVGLTDGRVRTRWTLPYQATPVAVLPSGVLGRTFEDHLQVVEPGSGRVRARLASAATFVDANGDRVAWLADRHLHVRNLTTGADTVVAPPPGSPGWQGFNGAVRRPGCCSGLGAFAPDGRTLAVYVRLAGPGAAGLAIVDLHLGRAALLAGSEGATANSRLPRLAWASDGWLYFLASGPAVTSIGAWRPGNRAAGLLRLDVDRAVDLVPSTLAAN